MSNTPSAEELQPLRKHLNGELGVFFPQLPKKNELPLPMKWGGGRRPALGTRVGPLHTDSAKEL